MTNLFWSDSFHLYFQYWHIFQWCYICQQWSVFKRDQHLSVMLTLKFGTMMIWNLISIIWSLRLKCGWRVNNCNIGLWIPAVKLHKLWLKVLKCGWQVNNCNIGLWIPAVKLHKLWLKKFFSWRYYDHFTPIPWGLNLH